MRSPRDRALARMRSLLVVAATASTSSACHRQRARGPEETTPYPEGYQVSDPVAPPPTQLSVARVDAKWVARGTWGIDASAIEIDLVLATTVPDLLVTIPSSTSPAKMIDATRLSVEPPADMTKPLEIVLNLASTYESHRVQLVVHVEASKRVVDGAIAVEMHEI